MTSTNPQNHQPTTETDVFLLAPLGQVPTLPSLCAKVMAANPETFIEKVITSDGQGIQLRHPLTAAASQQLIEAMRDLSYLKAVPLDNEFFAMFCDGKRSGLSRLDLHNCRIDDSTLCELLKEHGRNLTSLDVSAKGSLSSAAIPKSVNLERLQRLNLGGQMGLFSRWNLGNRSGLITSSCRSLSSLNIDLALWDRICSIVNEQGKFQAAAFLKDLLAPVSPLHIGIEVAVDDHEEVVEKLDDHLIDNLQSLTLLVLNYTQQQEDSPRRGVDSVVRTISKFRYLHRLDISEFIGCRLYYDINRPPAAVYPKPATTLFHLVRSLPLLQSLDISGTNLTSPVTDEDSIPCGPYRVNSSIPGLLGLFKPLKFLAVCACPNTDVSQIPADSVASFRTFAERMNAFRHYQSNPRMLCAVVCELYLLLDETEGNDWANPVDGFFVDEFREFLGIVNNRRVYESICEIAGGILRYFRYPSIAVLCTWAQMYRALPVEMKVDEETGRELFERIRQVGLQFLEMSLNKCENNESSVVDHSYAWLQLVIDLLPFIRGTKSEEVFDNQLPRLVAVILRRVKKPEWDGRRSRFVVPIAVTKLADLYLPPSLSAAVLSYLADRIRSGNEHVGSLLASPSMEEQIITIVTSCYNEWEKEIAKSAFKVLDAVWSRSNEEWQKNDEHEGSVKRSVWVAIFPPQLGQFRMLITDENIRKCELILQDPTESANTRFIASALIIQSMVINGDHQRNEIVWERIIDFKNQGTTVDVDFPFAHLVSLAGTFENHVVQLWAFWSVWRKLTTELEPLRRWDRHRAVYRFHKEFECVVKTIGQVRLSDQIPKEVKELAEDVKGMIGRLRLSG